ncbi:poly(A) polymerase [Streptomyces albipurpureus]|uniref:RNA repair domain-containing protein n=1 Tax=Streptomyces albipurpureus TaxID=2897419 RepID=A0ABT0UX11_9ACTN|nr:RNA repair domain-containing protein [Streptomyces sp. CWNU-1]MCM2393123.1 RNA repair domain-containing protein [Streptomyces sp. CWNU-1]
MQTSEGLYHRVRWDARFDPARFVLGVTQRGAEPKRVPLTSFVPGGEVPWHRVLFFEADGELVWDRRTGVDRIDLTDAGRAQDPRRLPSPFFTPITPQRWDGTTWVSTAIPRRGSATLRVLTWNTLWDRYGAELLNTERRRPLLLEVLRNADADVIALQEVTSELLRLIRATEWVREGYTLTPGGRDVDEYGLLLLSRLPVREAGHHVLGPHKALTAIVVDSDPYGLVTVAATHLTSDHTTDGATVRKGQLDRIAEGLAALAGPVVLLGDFNDVGKAAESRLELTDAWTSVHGEDDQTPTFDPPRNPLAALSSLTGQAGRLDRVLLRDVEARRAVLRGDTPDTDGLFASDHYGVEADLGPLPDPFVEATASQVRHALGEGAVHLVGSRRMGCALADADLDLVTALPGEVKIAAVRDRLAAALPDATVLRVVEGARVPGVRFRVSGLVVDLVVVGTGDIPPEEAVARRTELGESAAVALSAVSDAEAILEAVGERRDAFARLAREVKAWAHARGLGSAPFGGVPGIGWAVLAARTVREAGSLEGPELLRQFFGGWAAWDWRTAVGGPDVDLPMAIMTPSEPIRPCTERVSAAGRDRLAEELFRAWETLESAADPWPELLAVPPLEQRHCQWLIVTSPEDQMGRVRGRMHGLLRALEEAGASDVQAWPRPFAADPVRYAVGLGRSPLGSARLADVSAHWVRGLSGVRLKPWEGTGAPQLR